MINKSANWKRAKVLPLIFLSWVLWSGCSTDPGQSQIQVNEPDADNGAETQHILEDRFGGFYSQVRLIDKDAILMPSTIKGLARWGYDDAALLFVDFYPDFLEPVGGNPDQVYLYHWQEGLLESLRLKGYDFLEARATPLNNQILFYVLGGASATNTILYDLETGIVLKEFEEDVYELLADGNGILMVDYESRELLLGDQGTGTNQVISNEMVTSDADFEHVYGLELSPSRQNLAFVQAGYLPNSKKVSEILILEVESLHMVSAFEISANSVTLTWLPTETAILIRSGELFAPRYHILDLMQNCETRTLEIGPFLSVQISPSGDYILLESEHREYYAIVRSSAFMETITPFPPCTNRGN